MRRPRVSSLAPRASSREHTIVTIALAVFAGLLAARTIALLVMR